MKTLSVTVPGTNYFLCKDWQTLVGQSRALGLAVPMLKSPLSAF